MIQARSLDEYRRDLDKLESVDTFGLPRPEGNRVWCRRWYLRRRIAALLALVALSGCPDVKGECQGAIDTASTKISDELSEKFAAALASILPFFVASEFTKAGCVTTDAGLWSCAGSSLCEGEK